MTTISYSPAEQIVRIMNKMYFAGLTTSTGGNLSIKDRNGDIWMTPSDLDKARLTVDDIIKITKDGTVEGKHKPTIETAMHIEIYKQRQDIKAVLHAHPAMAIAIGNKGRVPATNLFPMCAMRCGKVEYIPYYEPGSALLADKVATAFGYGGNVAMLGNHGVVIGSDNLLDAFLSLEALNLACEVEYNALALGKEPKELTERHIALYRLNVTLPLVESSGDEAFEKEAETRALMCEYIDRAYRKKLFMSGNGALSCRVGKDAFLITASNRERSGIKPDELVLINGGKREEEKEPSNSAVLHRQIYLDNPEINSIMISHPQYTMTYAVTDAVPDIGKNYEYKKVIKSVKKLPFGSTILQPKIFSGELSPENPVYIVENDCMITCGNSIYDAFRKAEATESCAEVSVTENIF